MHDFDENKVLRDALSGLNEEVPPMPEGLRAAWMQKVEDDMEEKRTQKTRTMKTLTRWLSVAAAVVFVVGGTLLTQDELGGGTLNKKAGQTETGARMLGAALANDSDYYIEEEYSTADAGTGMMLTSMSRGVDTTATNAALQSDKKIIRTASLTIATQAFEDSLASLKTTCEGLGGWIESSSENVSNYSGLRTAYLTLRVPQSSLDAYLAGTTELGRITNRSESAQDVTESYQDTQTRLNTQLALMERLQALITESGDLSDLLTLESQIADTQYTIDRLQSSLNTTDRQVTYSTVNITLKEEKTVELTDTAVTFGDRIVSALQVGLNALKNFVENMAVFLVASAPFIGIVLIVILVIHIIKRRRKS